VLLASLFARLSPAVEVLRQTSIFKRALSAKLAHLLALIFPSVRGEAIAFLRSVCHKLSEPHHRAVEILLKCSPSSNLKFGSDGIGEARADALLYGEPWAEWAATGGLIHVSKFANMEHFSPTLERAIQIWSASFAASGAGGPEVT
jgi:hypothetical protein